jgi:hypothetical protein
MGWSSVRGKCALSMMEWLGGGSTKQGSLQGMRGTH